MALPSSSLQIEAQRSANLMWIGRSRTRTKVYYFAQLSDPWQTQYKQTLLLDNKPSGLTLDPLQMPPPALNLSPKSVQLALRTTAVTTSSFPSCLAFCNPFLEVPACLSSHQLKSIILFKWTYFPSDLRYGELARIILSLAKRKRRRIDTDIIFFL